MDLIERTDNIFRHPWELSRCSKMQMILKENDKNISYADIGSGDRYFTTKIRSLSVGEVYAVDTEYDKLESIQDGIICLKNLSQLENKSLDCIVLMDVLEHIENDQEFFKEVLEKLKPHGMILITVPAIQSLFSAHDAFLKHYRRYNLKRLKNLLISNGVKVEKMHYFYSALLIPRLFTVLKEKLLPNRNLSNKGIGQWDHSEKSIISRFICTILNIDFSINQFLNSLHIRIPGLSLLAVCKKNN